MDFSKCKNKHKIRQYKYFVIYVNNKKKKLAFSLKAYFFDIKLFFITFATEIQFTTRL